MIMVMVQTGMRVGELINFKISWLDPDDLSIRIQPNQSPREWEPKTTSSIRSLPITLDLLKALHRYLGNRRKGYIFKSQKQRTKDKETNLTVRTFGKYNRRTINRRVNPISREILGKNIGTHIFRHTYASHLLKDHLDIEEIRKLLGHSDINTTFLYIQSLPDFSSWDKVRKTTLMKLNVNLKYNEEK